jgi:hypothetical protein
MQTKDIETKAAPNKVWAVMDAKMRNIINASHIAHSEKIRAERMKLALELVYHAKGIYISYGKKGISVKVDEPKVCDRKSLRLLEGDWTKVGVTKKRSEQGVIYRFKLV